MATNLTRKELNEELERLEIENYEKVMENDEEGIKEFDFFFRVYFLALIAMYSKYYNPNNKNNVVNNVSNKTILKEVRGESKELYKNLNKKSKDIAEFAIVSSFVFNKEIKKEFFNSRIKIIKPTKNFINKILLYKNYNLTLKERMNLLTSNTNKRIEGIISNGLQNGLDPNVIKKQINSALNIANNQAKTIMRTESARVYNQAKLLELRSGKEAKKIIIIAVLDSRTTAICRFENNRVKKVDEIGMEDIPPFHYNCRSTFRPYVSTKEYKKIK